MKRIYFPGLNGIRFIAALLVIIHHIELSKSELGLANHWDNASVVLIGHLGVVLFFVLSGFLITYLLFTEQKQTKTISIKDFYLRRILRIWPLYYLLVAIAFFVLPHIPFLQGANLPFFAAGKWSIELILFVVFLPNFVFVFFPAVPYLSHAWSVGVEEQFYLIWPLLMKKIRNKKALLFGIVFIYLFLKTVGFKVIERYFFWNDTMEHIRTFVGDFAIDCMAIGGIYAYYLFNKSSFLNVLFNRYVQWGTLGLLTALILLGVHIPIVHYEAYSVLFGIVIVNLAGNPASVLRLETPVLNYLGKISYGLYMYHPLIIIVILKALAAAEITNPWIQYSFVISGTIAMSSISYQFIERYFIHLKVRFSRVISGDNAVANEAEGEKPAPAFVKPVVN